MNKLFATTSLFALALSSVAHADQAWPRWYIGLSGGVTYLDDSDVSGTATGEQGFDMGGVAAVSLGYQMPFGMQPFSNMRMELEAAYHENTLDATTLSGVSTASPGRLRVASYMVNAFYDFRNNSQMTPYVGAGVGIATATLSHNSGLGNTSDDEDNTMAYQFMAGLSYAPTSMPNTEWGFGYRYFVVDSPEYTTTGGKVKLDDVTAHTAEVGARFKF